MGFKVGDKIEFEKDFDKLYTVRACDDRYLICTRPIKGDEIDILLQDYEGYTEEELLKTVLYTIVDLDNNVRGPSNQVFSTYDYVIQEDVEQCLRDLQYGEVEISQRHRVKLDIVGHSNLH